MVFQFKKDNTYSHTRMSPSGTKSVMKPKPDVFDNVSPKNIKEHKNIFASSSMVFIFLIDAQTLKEYLFTKRATLVFWFYYFLSSRNVMSFHKHSKHQLQNKKILFLSSNRYSSSLYLTHAWRTVQIESKMLIKLKLLGCY